MEKGLIKQSDEREGQIYVSSHPVFSLKFSLGHMEKKGLPDMNHWPKAKETILDWTGIPAVIDYSLVNGQQVIPGFLFNRGHAIWDIAKFIGTSNIVASSIEFNYVMSGLKNQEERAFLRGTIARLEKKVFDYLRASNQNPEKHRESMEINYWMRVYSRLKGKMDGRRFEEPFLAYSMNGRTQEEIFDGLFSEVDRYLNGLPNRKNPIQAIETQKKIRALIDK